MARLLIKPCLTTAHVIPIAFLFVFFSGCGSIQGNSVSLTSTAQDTLWVREELYFGSDIPMGLRPRRGGMVTDSLLGNFINREVVSHIPDEV